jgi:hypothetical protein
MHFLKKILVLSFSAFVTFLACTENPAGTQAKTADIAISITADAASDFAAIASSAEVKISADGMPTQTQALTVSPSGISGNITGIVAGPGRKFEVFVYDVNNKLCYYGSSIGEVAAGGTANISLTLYRTNGEGNAIINGSVQPSNTPPVVSLTSPANNAQFAVGTAIQIAATATDADGSVSSVAFYRGTTLVSTDNSSPYTASFTPTTAGTYTFSAVATDNAGTTTTSATVTVTVIVVNQTSYKINCGGSAVSPYSADGYYSGGSTSSTTSAITITGITNPAPAAVYQVERYGAVTYTFPSLVSGGSYTVRLHFAELYWTASAKRRFNVAINGSQVLSSFDIYATAGAAKKAVLREFTATANASSQIVITLTNVTDNASICGIEIIQAATPPVITGPANQAICQGSTASLSVSASGGTSFTYQWYRGTPGSGTAISGATSATYATTTAGTYYCVVTNNSSLSATSSAATVTVNSAPVITTQPSSASICSGASATLSIVATGATGYQWYSGTTGSGTAISGATSASLSRSVAGSCYCVVTNASGCTVTSTAATVTVNSAPTITTQPSSAAICSGTNAILTVTATGASGYQWYRGTPGSGTMIAGATTSTYSTSTAGTYYCVVSNISSCTVSSSAATVSNTVFSVSQLQASVTACENAQVQLPITTSCPAASYSWYLTSSNGTFPITSDGMFYTIATNGTLTIPHFSQSIHPGYYYCTVTNNAGQTATTNSCNVTMPALSVGQIQSSIYACPNGQVQIPLTANCSAASFQWYLTNSNGTFPITSDDMFYTVTSTGTLIIPAYTDGIFAGSYHCTVTDYTGHTVTTNSCTIALTPLSVGQIQSSISACPNAEVQIPLTANCSAASFQWYLTNSNGTFPITSDGMFYTVTSTGTLIIPAYTDGIFAGSYRCVVTDYAAHTVTTNSCTITARTSGCP